MSRRVCFFTATRAEYGLLHYPMKAVQDTPGLEMSLVVLRDTSVPEFGLTYSEIEADGFGIDERVEMLLSAQTALAATKSLGLATIGYGEALQRLAPDLLVLLGDRYETLGAAAAATLANVPIAHIHGGETTEGAMMRRSDTL